MIGRSWVSRVLAPVVLVGMLTGGCAGSRANSAPAAPTPAPRAGMVNVEIAYLNHRPAQAVLADVEKLLAAYGDRVQVARYDFDSPAGKAFAKSRGLSEHTPLAIFINGAMKVTVNGQEVRFYSFPKGRSTFMSPDGAWTLDDLTAALEAALGART